MFKSLRSRLVFSHLLPSLIIIPLMGIAIVYVIENQVLLPRMEQEITDDVGVYAHIFQSQPEIWRDPQKRNDFIQQQAYDPLKRIMLLDQSGVILASTDPNDTSRTGLVLEGDLVQQAIAGASVSNLTYSQGLKGDVIDVMSPVYIDGTPVGIVRMSYRYDTVLDQLYSLRYWISGILLFGLLFGAGLGIFLALNIARPIQDVGQAIYNLASGKQLTQLEVRGPREVTRLVRAVNHLVSQLTELEQSRKQFLANLVHELGRPLGALRTSIQVSQRGAKNDPVVLDELLSGMDHETIRLQRLVEDLSNLHDQSLGRVVLNRQEIELTEWLPHALSTLHQEALKKGLQWELILPHHIPSVSADSIRLSQIVGNLVSNAIKYTPKGGKVSISLGDRDNEVWVKVQDTGIGILPEEQQRIFDPLFRGDQSRRIVQGMGLGLSIAKDLAELHGGSLTVESQRGLGSTFTFWMPVSQPFLSH